MIGFRPKTSALFLERPRLMRMLPEEPGYIVWLEAPYGYGKSVLTAQWVARLEADGWRVIWLALVEGDPREPLAGALGLAEDTPWNVVLRALGREKTAIILEDLENDPDAGASLGPLLKHTPGLVVLASRKALRTPELPRARAEGRLIHLKAEHLAFTSDEARALFGERDASEAWEQTRGWSLPLHMAALTGEVPDEDSLWDGVRDSLEPEEWQELLFLAALPYLPSSAANAHTHRLTALGFVQALERGDRLHPMAAEIILRNHPEAVKDAVRDNLLRLPLILQAEACARAGLTDQLGGLLEHVELAAEDAVGVLRWEALCQSRGASPETYTPARWLTLGWAYSSGGQSEQARTAYLRAAQHPGATPEQRLDGIGFTLYDLPRNLETEADALLAQAESVMPLASAESRLSFLNNAVVHKFNFGLLSDAEVLLERALALVPDNPHPETLINLAYVRWELHGALSDFIHTLQAQLQHDTNAFNRAATLNMLAETCVWIDPATSLRCLTELEAFANALPRLALVGRALAASIRRDLGAFPALELEAQSWRGANDSQPSELGMVYAYWARALRFAERGAQALALLEPRMDAFANTRLKVEYAAALHAAGRDPEALELLAPMLTGNRRTTRVEAMALRAQITQSAADVDALITMTDAREAVLGGLIPLDRLPRLKASWSLGYPVQTILRSGWKEAVQQRHAEIPPLELRVLGGFEVRVLDEPVALTARPRDILTLLALRLPRDQIAETLWPEADTNKSRNNLLVSLNALRKAVEPWGVPTYILESGLVRAEVDLWKLEDALERGDYGTVQHLYADLAPGFDLAPLEEYRDDLRERVLDGLLGYAQTASDDPSNDVEPTLEAILKIDPLNEEAFSRLLERMVASGRRVSAERRFREFARRLRDEMGLEPSTELRRVLRMA